MDNNSLIKVLIIPDVHGRSFWKDCVENYKELIENGVIDVVFLGDYLDPYYFEDITVIDAIKNFHEICKFAQRRKNVHLLLGNHDMPYYDELYRDSLRYKCRYSHEYAPEIEAIFKNYKLFNIAWETELNGKKYLFTHAGVQKEWVNIWSGRAKIRRIIKKYIIEGLEPTAQSLNKLTNSKKGITALLDVSEMRGGYAKFGSVIWADFHEHLRNRIARDYYDNIYQVCGHSLAFPDEFDNASFDKYYIDEHFAMLDARRGFILDNMGKIKEMKPLKHKV